VTKDPDRQRFESGDFVSVSFDEACVRLRKVVQSPISERAVRNFDTIRKHRNRVVHFYHGADLREVVSEQLRAWYDLQQLLTVQWKAEFNDFRPALADIEKRLQGNREYLQAKFADLEALIARERKGGAEFEECASCGFEAARTETVLGELKAAECLVCGYKSERLDYECSNCSEYSPLLEGGAFTCTHCGHREPEEKIAKTLNQFVATSDNYFEAMVPANCSECDGYHTIIEYHNKYLCICCFAVADALSACGWCSEFNNGDMENSDWSGCTVCDGRAGWDRDD
jgi:DNA-directed RNA polymerase subunit RPC12/RpoP